MLAPTRSVLPVLSAVVFSTLSHATHVEGVQTLLPSPDTHAEFVGKVKGFVRTYSDSITFEWIYLPKGPAEDPYYTAFLPVPTRFYPTQIVALELGRIFVFGETLAKEPVFEIWTFEFPKIEGERIYAPIPEIRRLPMELARKLGHVSYGFRHYFKAKTHVLLVQEEERRLVSFDIENKGLTTIASARRRDEGLYCPELHHAFFDGEADSNARGAVYRLKWFEGEDDEIIKTLHLIDENRDGDLDRYEIKPLSLKRRPST